MKLIVLNNCFLLALFVMSFFIVDEDIKSKRIPNGLLMKLFMIGLGLYCLAFITGAVSMTYGLEALLNTAMAFTVGFLIWKSGLWPAGDAKFFMACSFLIPLQYYTEPQFSYFPSFALLINVFLTYLVFMAYRFIVWALGEVLGSLGGGIFRRKGFGRLMKKKMSKVLAKIRTREFLWKIFCRVSFKIFFQVFFIALTLVLFTNRTFRLQSFSFYFFFFLFLRILFRFFVQTSSLKAIKAVDIKGGMNLSSETVKQIRRDKAFFAGLDDLRAEGITRDQASLIKEHLIAKGILTAHIYETVPFSPFIALGAAATVLAHGSLLEVLRQLR